jgi:enterochelin esterase-like enzyme
MNIIHKLFRSLTFLLVLYFCFMANVEAQIVENTNPASTNIDSNNCPCIKSDLSVFFRVKAPDAKKVQIDLGKLYDMVKDDQGIWSVTTEPQVPGFHYYSLVIDGVKAADPASYSFFGMSRMASGIEIPEAGVDFYLPKKDVPQGALRSQLFFSKVTGTYRRMYIYTPPGYEQNTDQRYPVLYLQHGGGEDERGWAFQGKVDIIMNSLIAEGKTKPMIIVMNSGYAHYAGTPAPVQDLNARSTPGFFVAFEDMMIKDVIPFIDSAYRTIADSENRAMAGLSWGAKQTMDVTTHNLDKFSYIGAFSGAVRLTADSDIKTVYNGAFSNPDEFNQKVHLLWLGIGSVEGPGTKNFHEALTKTGIKSIYYESPGTAHEWLTWKRCLYNFAPLLFQK